MGEFAARANDPAKNQENSPQVLVKKRNQDFASVNAMD
jgi:hypothetical protein